MEKLTLMVVLLLGVVAPAALADGGFVPRTGIAKVSIPDQRALIHHADGMQTLVIDTSVSSTSTNLAWIIPLPAPPEMEPSTRGLFTTLSMITAPRIFHDQSYEWILLLVFACIPITALTILIRGGPNSKAHSCGLLVAWFLSGLLLPAMGTARSGSASASSVEILKRETVGSHDTVVIRADTGADVVAWFDENGFETPAAHLPVIEDHVREGWVFVAARVNVNPVEGTHRVHPVVFRFPVEQAVYPLRLTAVNNEECRFELYVFGDQRAEIPGWTVERSGRLVKDGFDRHSSLLREGIAFAHPELLRLVPDAAVATKLSATLSPEQMSRDAVVGWVPFRDEHPLRFSWHGAKKLAINVFVCGIISVATGLYLLGSFKPFRFLNRLRVWAIAISLVAAVAAGLLLLPPKIEVVSTRTPQFAANWNARYLPRFAWLDRIEEREAEAIGLPSAPIQPVSIQEVRAEFERFFAGSDPGYVSNPLTGEPMIEEDSPGNYTLEQMDDGTVEFKGYGLVGQVISHHRFHADAVEDISGN